MAKFEIPEGFSVQAFRFTLDLTDGQARSLARHFGARRKAYNWAVAALKADIVTWRETGVETAKPSLAVLRKRWNTAKDAVCVNAATGDVVAGVLERGLRRRDRRRGGCLLELAKPPAQGPAPASESGSRGLRRRAATPTGCRFQPGDARRTRPPAPHAASHRHSPHPREHPPGRAPHPGRPSSGAGDQRAPQRHPVRRQRAGAGGAPSAAQRGTAEVTGRCRCGVRRLATVASTDGAVLERVPNPRPLDAALNELRHVSRARSRCVKGSRQYRERTTEMSRLHRRVNDVRVHHLHVLTTRLAKTHGRIVVEGLDAAGMLRQKGLPGHEPADAACPMPPWVRRGTTCPTRPSGTDHNWWWLIGGSLRRRLATRAGMFRTSAGQNTGPAIALAAVAGHSSTRRLRRDQPRTLRGTR